VAPFALALSLALLAPSWARADWDWDDDGSSSVGDGAGVAAVVLYGFVDLVYLSADTAAFAQRRWLRPGWASTQVVWGALNMAMGLVIIPASLIGTDNDRGWFRFGVSASIIGTFFLVHGIRHLRRRHERHWRARDPMPPQPATRAPISWRFGLTPIREGAMASVGFSF
jgi:Na+/melibiose symporter-like transporter